MRFECEGPFDELNLLSSVIFLLDGDFQLEICHFSKVTLLFCKKM